MSALPGFELPAPEAPIPPRFTERDVLALLHERYAQRSQGSSIRYALAEHVRSHAGFDARRTIDFMAFDLWPMQGLHLHGHEVKISRSDWLRELRDPTKAEEFKRYCDRWWLVVPDASIVKREELPDGWGLLAPRADGKLVAKVSAPKLTPQPWPRTFIAAFARALQVTKHRELARVERLYAESRP
jgi:hypothetical protein